MKFPEADGFLVLVQEVSTEKLDQKLEIRQLPADHSSL